MKSMNEVEQSLKQLESAGDPAIHKRILDGLVSEMEKGKEQRAGSQRWVFWRSALRSSVVRIGAPAGAVVVLLIAFVLIGLKPVDAQAVMRQVAAKVETIQAEVYNVHTSTVINDRPANEDRGVVYHSVLHGSRRDIFEGGRLVASKYMLPGRREIISVNHSRKEYMRSSLSEATAEQLAGLLDVRQWLDSMAKEGRRTSGIESLGKRKINGIEAMGFALDKYGLFGKDAQSQEGFMRLWVDPEEYLPVLMEIEYTLRAPPGGGRYEKRTVSVTSRDFQWDITLGPDTFEPDIAEDYTLVRPADSDVPAETGQKAVKSGGDGPDVFDSATGNGP